MAKPRRDSYAAPDYWCPLLCVVSLLPRRWDGDFLTASSLIKCGVLGRLVEFESHFDRYRPALKMGWKEDAELPGAGVLYDLGIYYGFAFGSRAVSRLDESADTRRDMSLLSGSTNPPINSLTE